jgi:hypothetical protein
VSERGRPGRGNRGGVVDPARACSDPKRCESSGARAVRVPSQEGRAMHGRGDEERRRRDRGHRGSGVRSLYTLRHERTSHDDAVAGVSRALDGRAAAFMRVVAGTLCCRASARQAPQIAHSLSDGAAGQRHGDQKCRGTEHGGRFKGNRGAIHESWFCPGIPAGDSRGLCRSGEVLMAAKISPLGRGAAGRLWSNRV